ncbi:hypothetical protein ACWKW9_19290 [Rhizobium daejeonense]
MEKTKKEPAKDGWSGFQPHINEACARIGRQVIAIELRKANS